MSYQRTVTAYHGCDQFMLVEVLLRGKPLRASENPYDWLGRGIYFWEHGPQRALEWAAETKVRKPCVLGAFLHLGNCFDLLDTAYTDVLRELFERYRRHCEQTGAVLPQNRPARGEAANDLLLRYLDCAVVNWGLDYLEGDLGLRFHTVRCVFSEGQPAFPGSKIFAKSHIQIAVRDASVIIGYFKPNLDLIVRRGLS